MLAGTIKDGARFPLSESSVRQYWFMCDGDEEGTDMTDSPRTWHFGLMAQWWAEFNLDAATEVAYLRPLIEDDGQPALDLACGTGRVLLPLLEAGLDVDGCDMSADMLAGCRRRGAQKGLTPNLYAQAMHAGSRSTTALLPAVGSGRSSRLQPLPPLFPCQRMAILAARQSTTAA
jgi:SAM-dependent methyltransferase